MKIENTTSISLLGAKSMESITFLVWSEMTLGMYLTAGGSLSL